MMKTILVSLLLWKGRRRDISIFFYRVSAVPNVHDQLWTKEAQNPVNKINWFNRTNDWKIQVDNVTMILYDLGAI